MTALGKLAAAGTMRPWRRRRWRPVRPRLPLITTRGLGLLVAASAALAAGFAFGYPELGLLGTTGLVAVVCAVAYTAWRPALRVTRVAEPDRVSRGEGCTVALTVRNDSWVRAATLIAEDRCGEQTIPVPLVRLRPRLDTQVSYPVPTERRGVVPIGPLRVGRQDPLGLAAVNRSHGDTVRVWVYPRVLPLTTVPVGVARSLDGRIDRVPHGSITFDTLREYVIGDELRRVHWRTSARVGELMVREHLDTSLPRIVVLLDNRAEAYPDAVGGFSEAFESACEAAASVVAAAVREELPIALRLVAGATDSDTAGKTAPPGTDTGGRRAESARPFLDLLAEAELRAIPRGRDKGARKADSAGRDGGAAGPLADDAPALRTAVDRLWHTRAGDTLVYLTGPGGRAGLGEIATLRGRYPSVLATVFAGQRPCGEDGTPASATTGGAASGNAGAAGATGGAAPKGPGASGTTAGLLVVDANGAEDFAAEWEAVRRW